MSEEVETLDEGIDIEELGKRYETKGFFSRLITMMSGLGKPHNTREYKEARIEMQRLMAPLIAIIAVVLFVVILIVVTAISGKSSKTIEVTVATAEEVEEAPEEQEQEEPPDEPPPEPPPMEDVEIQIDNPTPGPVSNLAPIAAPPATQVSVKPATQDTVAFVNSPVKMKSMVGSRTPGSIGAATRGGAMYGDQETERAVYKALRWLKKTQVKDGDQKGSWEAAPNCHYKSRAACTGLALLTFLAHGETPKSKEFGETVKNAIEWITTHQKQTKGGTWTIDGAGAEEYGFLISTYALCEAYGMTKNPNVKEAALHGLTRMVKNQSPTGGWNYGLKSEAAEPDDISYGGWCIQAIKAGKLAGIHVDGMEECIAKAINCLRTRNANKRTGFAYRPGKRYYEAYAGLAGVGCLAMQLLGYGKDQKVRDALEVMKGWRPNFDVGDAGPFTHEHPKGHWQSPQYYYYYASQCKFQAGMAENASAADKEAWAEWNKAMKAFYPNQMKADGTIPGPDGKPRECAYWQNNDRHSARPVMDTCLAALQLMVYYRYLPQATLKAKEEKRDGAAAATDKGDVSVDVDI